MGALSTWRSPTSGQSASQGSPPVLEALEPRLLLNGGPPELPDLAGGLSTVPFPETPADGHVAVQYHVINVGTAAAGGSTARIYFSEDANVSGDDALVHTSAVPPLGPAGVFQGAFDLDLPAPDPFLSSGNYYLLLVTDADGDVTELDESDNTSSTDLFSDAHIFSVTWGAAVEMPLIPGGGSASTTGNIGEDEWIGARDMDLYWLFAGPGQRLRFDVDRLSGDLDSYLRLYDTNWDLVAENDNGTGEAPETSGLDSAMEVQIPAVLPPDARYYVLVSAKENSVASPSVASGRTEGTTGDYRLTVSAVPMPDLTGTRFDESVQVIGGDGQAVVDLTVENQGTDAADAFTVQIVLSDDSTIGTPDDTVVTSFRVSNLGAGAAYTLDGFPVQLPASGDVYLTDNEYWLGMVIDSGGEVQESDETDNANTGDGKDRDSVKSEIHLPSPVDGTLQAWTLTVGDHLNEGIGDYGQFTEWSAARDIDVHAIQVAAGQTLCFDVDRTGGNLDSYLRLYDAGMNLLAGNDNARGMAPEPNVTDSFLRHEFATGGTYFLVISSAANAAADPRQLQGRADGSTGSFDLHVYSPPDLIATSCSAHFLSLYQNQISADFSVMNQGAVAAGPFDVRFFLSEDPAISGADDLFVANVRVSGLDPGQMYNGRGVSLNLPDFDPYRTDNAYFIGMVVDHYDEVAESDEDNNANIGPGVDKFPFYAEFHAPSPGNQPPGPHNLTPDVPYGGGAIGPAASDSEWMDGYDVDVYQFAVSEVTGVWIDIDRISGNLDSYIRLYDQQGCLLAENDNGPGELPEPSPLDSAIEYTCSPGLYRIVVSSTANAAADPYAVDGRIMGSMGQYRIIVEDTSGREAPPEALLADRRTVMFRDADGTRIRARIARGDATLRFEGENIRVVQKKRRTLVQGDGLRLAAVQLGDTSDRTRLSLRARGGDGTGTVANIAGGTIGRLNAAGMVLTGRLNALEAAGRIAFAALEEANLQVAGLLECLRAGSVLGSIISAGEAGSRWRVRGSVIDSTLAAAGGCVSVKAGGSLIGSSLDVAELQDLRIRGAMYGSRASADNIRGTASVKGGFIASSILAGVDAGADRAWFTDDDAAIAGAGHIGRIRLRRYQPDNADEPFGILAGALGASARLGSHSVSPLARDFSDGDFCFRLV